MPSRMGRALPSLLLLPALTLSFSLLTSSDAQARRVRPTSPPIPTAHCADVRGIVFTLAARQAVDAIYGYPYMPYHRGGIALDAATTAESSSAKGGGGHFTGTNNQENGVDEADMVKTDGRYIYTIADGAVVITSARPTSRMRVLARYKLPKGVTPQRLQLYKNKLVILSTVYEQKTLTIADPKKPVDGAVVSDAPAEIMIAPRRPMHRPTFVGTRVTVLDVRNRSYPRVLAETDLEGYVSQSRMIGDDLYLATNGNMRVSESLARIAKAFAAQLPKLPVNVRYDGKAIEAARKKGMAMVLKGLNTKARFSPNDAMPRVRTRSYVSTASRRFRPMYSCSQLVVPAGTTQSSIIGVAHIDLDRPTSVSATGIAAHGGQVYVSQSSLYVAATNWGYQNNGGKEGTTSIHKFGLKGFGGERPMYHGNGTVPGYLLNQFSMSEHRGFLRVMTTDQQWGSNGRNEKAGNNLFILGEARRRSIASGNRLRVVGSIKGLAAGERIFSARMFGDKGYMVTFRQTDPLFTFDLSNPYSPKLVGELKINGFSSYIHPLGGDKLLTIGRDADDDGRVKGLHLQIFDVSNPAEPVRTHHKLFGGERYAWSSAQHDHHAFTYDPKTKILALPVSNWNRNSMRSGLEVFKVDGRRGFLSRGFVTHADLIETNSSDQYASYRWNWKAQVQRSMIIGNSLVSVSTLGIKASSLWNPGRTLSSLKFTDRIQTRVSRWSRPWWSRKS